MQNRGGRLVSVVIPAYKAEGFIEQAIESIRRQEYRPIEVVVVEDCSPDGTASTVEHLISGEVSPDFTIRLLRQPQNSGAAAALARGFAEAEGDFVCWLSADDAYVGEEKLGAQVASLTRRAGVSYGESFYAGPNPDDLDSSTLIVSRWHPERRVVDRVMDISSSARLLGLIFRVPINGSTVMISREVLKRFGGFDTALGNVDADGDLWLRYSALGVKISAVPLVCGFYRLHPGQTSNLTEECHVGTAVTRIRMMSALDDAGKLAPLLRWYWPVLALAHRRQWYRCIPLAAAYLCRASLKLRCGSFATEWLHRINDSLKAEGLVDERLLELAVDRARVSAGTEEFARFVQHLG